MVNKNKTVDGPHVNKNNTVITSGMSHMEVVAINEGEQFTGKYKATFVDLKDEINKLEYTVNRVVLFTKNGEDLLQLGGFVGELGFLGYPLIIYEHKFGNGIVLYVAKLLFWEAKDFQLKLDLGKEIVFYDV